MLVIEQKNTLSNSTYIIFQKMVTQPLFFSLLVLFLNSRCKVQGRPEGAPKDACLTLNPDHSGTEPQKTPLPYDLRIDEIRPHVDHKLTFTILSKSNDTKIGGFMVQARELEFISNPFGTFVPTKGSVRVLDCLGGYNVRVLNNFLIYLHNTILFSLDVKLVSTYVGKLRDCVISTFIFM